ncbi:AGAP008555-PA, partial [Anopheles gambiae str. PEST]
GASHTAKHHAGITTTRILNAGQFFTRPLTSWCGRRASKPQKSPSAERAGRKYWSENLISSLLHSERMHSRWEHTVGGAGLFKCGAFCAAPMGCFPWNSRVSPHKSSPDHVRPAKKRDVRTINSSSSDLGPPSKTNGAQPARSSAARAAAALRKYPSSSF